MSGTTSVLAAPRPTPADVASCIGSGLRNETSPGRPAPQVIDLYLTVVARVCAGAWSLVSRVQGKPVVIGSGSWADAPSDDAWGARITDLERVLDQAHEVFGRGFQLATLAYPGKASEPMNAWLASHRMFCPTSPHEFDIVRLGKATCDALLREMGANCRTIYTDGSASCCRTQGGAGWVDSDGNFGAFPVKSGLPIVAEVTAIRSALSVLPSWIEKVVIYTDSLDAVRAVNDIRRAGSTDLLAWNVAERLRKTLDRVTQTTQIEMRWVKGHSGHVMNECADRLAVLARRYHDAGLGLDEIRTRATSIVVEMLGDSPHLRFVDRSATAF